MDTFKNVMMRIFAVIAAESLGVIGAGSLVGIEVWQAATLAGALGAARCLLYTSPSPRDRQKSRMPSSA